MTSRRQRPGFPRCRRNSKSTRSFDVVGRRFLVAPNGEIGHAEIKIGSSAIMLADSCETGVFRSPQSLGGSTIGLHVYIEDVDALFAQAVDAGAKVVRPLQDQFYGDRTGTLEDPFGHVWFIATHKEDLTAEEINQRAQALFKQGAA